MNRWLADWLTVLWQRPDAQLREDYRLCFTSLHGRRVLQHLLDTVYCTIYEGSDPVALGTLNGRRSLVHEILELLDQVEHPDKYRVTTEAGNGLHG